MGRLIDGDTLKEVMIDVLEHIKQNPKMDGQERHIIAAIATLSEMIDDAPTVDAVEVVRCKDCKYWKTGEGVNLSKKVKFCTYQIGHKYARHYKDFCSRGEQKDGDQNG